MPFLEDEKIDVTFDHGNWQELTYDVIQHVNNFYLNRCSACKTIFSYGHIERVDKDYWELKARDPRFCPNCGARLAEYY